MPCRTTCYEVYLAEGLDILVSDTDLSEVDVTILALTLDVLVESISYNLRLLVDLLQHEVLVATLLSSCSIHLYMNKLLLDDITIQVVELRTISGDLSHL